MKTTALLTAAALFGLAGMASAQCMWGSSKATTASTDMTPIPTADAGEATEAPTVLLPQTAETGEG